MLVPATQVLALHTSCPDFYRFYARKNRLIIFILNIIKLDLLYIE